jgi:hypothetical protein
MLSSAIYRFVAIRPFAWPVHPLLSSHQFDGEKDSRGPMDFVNAAPSKPDEDDEDSEMVNTDTLQGSVPGKRSIDGTIKSRYHASKSSSEGTDMSKPGVSDGLGRPCFI